MPRKGRLSKEERQFIHQHADTMTPEDIADQLDRHYETVVEFIRLNVRKRPTTSAEDAVATKRVVIRNDLRNSEQWRNLKKEFTADELKFFEESYVKLMTQFEGDVLPSEETQIFQVIKFDILMSRNLQERKKAKEDIERLEQIQKDFLDQFGGDLSQMTEDDREFATNLESQIQEARTIEQSRTNEFVKLQERHDSLLKSLKAVRTQRAEQLETSKVSFIEIIKMLQDRDIQQKEGRQMELIKMAGKNALKELGTPTKYEDETYDSPIFSADTIPLYEEEANTE